MAATEMTKHGSRTATATERAHETPVFTPRVDIRETEAEIVLMADMPGVDETNVSIDIEGSELAIRGAFVPEGPDGYTLSHREYGNGDYERAFTLGDTIDRSGIKATVKDGVLRLVLPKSKEVQPKRIAVKAG